MDNNYVLNEEEMIIPEKMNIFKRLANLFFSPKKLFSYIRNKPSILFPIIILCIGTIVVYYFTNSLTQGAQLDLLYENYKNMGMDMSPDEIKAIMKVFSIVMLAASPFIVLAGWAISTLVLYLIFRLANCEKGLKKYFSMMAYISLIPLIGSIIHILFLYYTGADPSSASVTSLASLIDAQSVGSVLFSLAASLEFFSIWRYILIGIGFVYVGRVEKKKSYTITLILFLITVLLNIGLAAVQNQFAGFMP